MAIAKITSDYAYMSDGNLLVKANTILLSMTDNPSFPTPVPTLASVEEVKIDYQAALTAAQSRDKTKVAIKNERRDNLVETLRALGNYVTQTAGGDAAVLVGSGYTLAKGGLPAPPITNPEGFRVANGLNPGEVVASVNAVKGARSYLFECTADPITDSSVWTVEAGTRRKFTFTGLTPTKIYWFRVAAVGPSGQKAYSEMLSKIVQ